MLKAHGDWVELGAADEQKDAKPGPSRPGVAIRRTRRRLVRDAQGLSRALRDVHPAAAGGARAGRADPRRQGQQDAGEVGRLGHWFAALHGPPSGYAAMAWVFAEGMILQPPSQPPVAPADQGERGHARERLREGDVGAIPALDRERPSPAGRASTIARSIATRPGSAEPSSRSPPRARRPARTRRASPPPRASPGGAAGSRASRRRPRARRGRRRAPAVPPPATSSPRAQRAAWWSSAYSSRST